MIPLEIGAHGIYQIWAPDPADPMRTDKYPVLCGLQTDRTLFVLVRHADPKRPGGRTDQITAPDRIAITVEPLHRRGASGHVDNFDGLYIGEFNPPPNEVRLLTVVVTVNDEPYSTTEVTRRYEL